MRKLITIAAAGMLVLSVAAPAMAYEPETSPNGPGTDGLLTTTSVSLTVVEGTTVYAPATVTVGTVSSNSGAYPGAGALIPGQTATGGGTVYWISNEASKAMYVDLTTQFTHQAVAADPMADPPVVAVNDTIPYDDVFLAGNAGSYTWLEDLEEATHVKVLNIAGEQSQVAGGDIGDTLESGNFGIKVIIPAAPAAEYVGTLTFTVGGASSY
jgi:hypothetical protein